MLENVNLQRVLAKKEYAQVLPVLQQRLYDLEKACWDCGVSSVVIFEGWDASGKGGAIATLTERLDPRGFKMHNITPPRSSEARFPWLRRFWLRVPDRGEMAIFDRSWYRRVLEERVEEAIPRKGWRQAYRDIVEFERMLADDGVAIVKFFFHISPEEQQRRFRRIRKDPLEAWRITDEEIARGRKYPAYAEAVEEMLELTEAPQSCWTVVEATCRRFARRKVFETLIHTLEGRLGGHAPASYQPGNDADLRKAMRSMKRSARRQT